MIPAAYLGRGWAFPVRPDPVTRALDLAAGPEKVAQSIQIILDTDPGERAMRPAFGCGLRRFLMEPNTVATRALIQQEVESALAAFEPRIHVTSVNVSPGDDPALVFIAIAYVHIRDQTSANLVFPFYLQ
jgi:phage baseplate assembly protein W